MFASNTLRTGLRTLALAAAMTAPLASFAAHAETGASLFGITASPAWSQAQVSSRTPLASRATAQGQAAQNFLEESGATGGDGQHS